MSQYYTFCIVLVFIVGNSVHVTQNSALHPRSLNLQVLEQLRLTVVFRMYVNIDA